MLFNCVISSFLLFIFLPCYSLGLDSIIAYDCKHADVKSTLISLLAPPPCELKTITPTNVSKVQIQVLQKRFNYQVQVNHCKIERRISIFRCSGTYSYKYDVPEDYYEDLVVLSSEQCSNLLRDRMYITPHGYVIDKLRINGTTTFSEFLAGHTTEDSFCKGADWAYTNKKYTSVVVKAYYKILLQTSTAIMSLSDNKITLHGGITCNYDNTDSPCIHPLYGPTYWSDPKLSCSARSWITLYTGIADLIETQEQSTPVIAREGEDISFAIEITGTFTSCGRKLLRTRHSSLYILRASDSYELFRDNEKSSTTDIDFALYVNSKFVYFDRSIRKNFESIYTLFSYHQCEIDRKRIATLQSLAYLSGLDFAYSLKMGPGHTAEIRGEVAMLIDCVPVPVTYRQVSSCFIEMPVTHNNKSLFLTPRSRILSRYGSEVDCGSLLPVLYNLGSNWYNLYPHLMVTKNPDQILSTYFNNFSYTSPVGLAGGGLYSSDDIEKYQNRLLLGSEQSAMSNNLARGFSGVSLSIKQGSLLQLLDQTDYINLQKSLKDKLWDWTVTFSHIGSAIFGIIMVTSLIIKVLNTLASGYELQKTFGWTWKLLICWWTSLVHVLLLRNMKNTTINKEGDKISKEEDPSSIPLTSIADDKVSHEVNHPSAPPNSMYPGF